jgi:energy-coupling factor transporter ATP-binding protein EcfA2
MADQMPIQSLEFDDIPSDFMLFNTEAVETHLADTAAKKRGRNEFVSDLPAEKPARAETVQEESLPLQQDSQNPLIDLSLDETRAPTPVPSTQSAIVPRMSWGGMQAWFELHHAKVGALCAKWGDGMGRRRHDITLIPPTELFHTYAQLKYYGDPTDRADKGKPFIRAWWSAENVRRFERACLAPPGTPVDEGVLRMWPGFAAERLQRVADFMADEQAEAEAGLKLIQDFIFEDVCNKGVAKFDEVVKWLAEIVQNPGKWSDADGFKYAPILLIFGTKGAGKDTLAKLMTALVGEEMSSHSEKPRNIFGDYNAPAVKGKVLCTLSEGRLSAEFQDTALEYVTNETLTASAKYANNQTVPNLLHIIWTTNHTDCVKFDASNRHFFCIQISDRRVGDTEFFTRMYAAQRSKVVLRRVYEWLMSVDLSSHVGRHVFPHDDEALIIEASRHPLASFAAQWALHPEGPPRQTILNTTIQAKFALFCSQEQLDPKVYNIRTDQLALGMKVHGGWAKDTVVVKERTHPKRFDIDFNGWRRQLLKQGALKQSEVDEVFNPPAATGSLEEEPPAAPNPHLGLHGYFPSFTAGSVAL